MVETGMGHKTRRRAVPKVGSTAAVVAGMLLCVLGGVSVLHNSFVASDETQQVSGDSSLATALSANPASTLLQPGDAPDTVSGAVPGTVPGVTPGAEASPAPPFDLPGLLGTMSYSASETLESWRAVSGEECVDFARALLEQTREQNITLSYAGFLDLSGECWGCVGSTSTGESLSVTLLPQHPFAARSLTNQLAVTIVCYRALPPEILAALPSEILEDLA